MSQLHTHTIELGILLLAYFDVQHQRQVEGATQLSCAVAWLRGSVRYS
jgi:hypothetical protein